jgi:glutamine amidotransferase-like uncharacterized protein
VRFYFPPTKALRLVILVVVAILVPITFSGCGASPASGPLTTKVAAPTNAIAEPVVGSGTAATGGSSVAATGGAASAAAGDATAPVTDSSTAAPAGDAVFAAAALTATSSVPPVLLFNGTGTSSSDVAAVEAVLSSLKLKYATVNTSQLNSMSEAKLKSYRLFLVPGGNSVIIGEHLTKTATANVHNAIAAGLHYLGICAGGFFGGYSIHNALNVAGGVWFNLYNGTSKQVAHIRFPNSPTLDIYEQDGPNLAGWGSVVGQYSNGKPAITEGKVGQGFAILCGVHPEAPASWRYGMKFNTPLATDLAFARSLVTHALSGTALPHF